MAWEDLRTRLRFYRITSRKSFIALEERRGRITFEPMGLHGLACRLFVKKWKKEDFFTMSLLVLFSVRVKPQSKLVC